MAFQEVSLGSGAIAGETSYPKLSDTAAGSVLAEGVFTGSHEGQYGLTYYVQQADGNSVGLNSWGKLRALIDAADLVENKSIVRITYLGMVTIEEGNFAGREAHNFKLEVDNSAITKPMAVNS